ncbi:uncharacterized protein DUF4199 [Roseivirga pacifica]|uniref:DUF4199 domain-containing protein n=1 Tax=Roseivirga pacifica TaxID=1267423 RepID=A0A1I0P3I5_9BACT|nr:DUF4199 domain-containing protein [Roseivirga pacifica]RKQ51665.1 uncharacterized protein DUF4199 [Roseivirga pacifica]SEW08554.1 Protein of unknown function [Roseivirga pacifica]
MKKIIQKYGVISSALVVGIPLLTIPIMGTGPESFAAGEVVGYSTILVAELLILLALYSYKKEQNGLLTFGESMKLGTSIAALGGLAFGLYNVVYVLIIDPKFNEKYFAYSMGLDVNSPTFKQQFDVFMADQGFMMSVPGQFLLMFLTVFLIGFIITIVGGLIFQSKGKAVKA